MNVKHSKSRAFTLVELLVLLAIIAVLAAIQLPVTASTKTNVQRINCSDNLKRISVAFRTWSESHNSRMPTATPSVQGGASEAVGTRATGTTFVSNITPSRKGVFGIFVVMSNELATPKILYCPSEYRANIAQGSIFGDSTSANVGFYNDNGTSYFVGVDANDYLPRMFLTGDHNLGDTSNPPGVAQIYGDSSKWFVSLGTNGTPSAWVGWGDNQHRRQGNVGLTDGSVQNYSRATLQAALGNTGDSGRFSGSFVQANTSQGTGANRLQFP